MSQHSTHSSYREKLIEHLFVGELLKLAWKKGDCRLEVAKPEVDYSGYDVIVESNGILRHVQLKASYIGGKTSGQKVHMKLAEKSSGCVIWICFNAETLELGPYYFYGGRPGKPLPDISSLKIAKHTKGNKEGFKADRVNIRVLKKGAFKKYNTIEEINKALFG